ncbi:MAG: hypothetical protein HWN81_00400 [Candidatus Lokiarchaeota archaeon]|nr:hypothetical protein [Candidatus Lokiarchaeota archaeon]
MDKFEVIENLVKTMRKVDDLASSCHHMEITDQVNFVINNLTLDECKVILVWNLSSEKYHRQSYYTDEFVNKLKEFLVDEEIAEILNP